jgi:hypothetical protein
MAYKIKKIDDVLNIELKDMKMETKEMTKEEVFEYLNNTKIICTSDEETVKVQKKLFELCVEWMLLGKKVCEDKYLLFINERQQLQHCSDINYWIKDINRRIEPSEILCIKIKEEEKPKFNPKTLQPFDKVLVRENDKHKEWFARFFEYYADGAYHTTSGSSWKYCIPYNDETKHLHGIIEEAPDYYKNW